MDLIEDAKNLRIAELQRKVEDLQETVNRQSDTITGLQKSNQILEKTINELQQSDDLNLSLKHSLSIPPQDDSEFGQCSDAVLSAKAQSIKSDDDDVYSSGDDTETFKTLIGNDHELLPLKQGILKKKSETIHKYNTRYLVLYPRFLLYYDQCPIKIQRHRGRKTSMFNHLNQSISNKEASNCDINHPKGSIFLRNYHVAVRKDAKKKRFDITFVPHESAVAMGLAAEDARIRFRCSSAQELSDWTDKIRTAITSAHSGFIKYDVRTDFITNDLTDLYSLRGDNNDNNTSNNTNNDDPDQKEEDEKNRNLASGNETGMFDINDLKQMMQHRTAMLAEVQELKRKLARCEMDNNALKTDLAIKSTEIESAERVAERQQRDLKAKMEDIMQHETTLKEEIAKLRAQIAALEQRQRDQHHEIKRLRFHEESIESNVCVMRKWNNKMKENSLQYLSKIYPQSTTEQLFETCHRGCVELLEDCQEALRSEEFAERGIMMDHVNGINGVNGGDDEEVAVPQRKSSVRESKLCRDMMTLYRQILKGHLNTTLNYTSLQQAHNGMMKEHEKLKKEFEEYREHGGDNSLEADALIMASMTTALF